MKNYFIKGACLALAISATSIFAPNASAMENTEPKVFSSQKEEVNKNLVKIDTSAAGGGELSLDASRLNDFKILFDGVTYIIKAQKLVKDESLTIMPLGLDSYNVTLNNGQTHTKEKIVYANSIILFDTKGPAEKREINIWEGDILIGTLTRASSGVGLTVRAVDTGPYYFDVTNYSASKQTWAVSIQF